MKERAANLKETKTCTGSESADGVAAHGSKEYSENMQIRVVWQSADGSVADQLEGEKFHIL